MDTREWKEFKVGDVFECKTTKTMLDPEQGDYLYITRTSENNGITDLIKLEDGSFLNNGNCITIGAEGLYAFYQNKDFIAGVKIYALRNEKMNKYSALFVCTMLNQVIYQYSYGRARILEKIKDEMVLLPITPDNQPDWQFMEDFIKKIYNKVIDEVKASAPALLSLQNRSVLKCDEWKEFKVGEVFDVVLSSGDLKLEECEAGETPLISSGETNNGIVGFITKDEKDKSQIFKNCITIDMFCNAYYQPFNIYAVSHGRVNMLVPKQEMSKFACLFICTLLNNEEYRFNYGRAVYSNTAENITLNLPTTPQGEPDFEWMGRYMRRLIVG